MSAFKIVVGPPCCQLFVWPAHFSDGSAVPLPTAPEAVKCVSPLCPRCGSGARDPKITCCHGRPHIGANGVSWPVPGKIDEKLKNENMQKEQFSMFMLYFVGNQGRQVYRTALCWPHIYSGRPVLQNAPFRSQIVKIFFASDGKEELTSLTKILRTLLHVVQYSNRCLNNFATETATSGCDRLYTFGSFSNSVLSFVFASHEIFMCL